MPFHLAKVPFGPLVPFLLKIGSLLTLMDAGFGDLIWGGRANRLDLRGGQSGYSNFFLKTFTFTYRLKLVIFRGGGSQKCDPVYLGNWQLFPLFFSGNHKL